MKKILIVANTGFAIYGFRLNLMKSLVSQGWEVVALANDEADFGDKVGKHGIRFINLPIDHKGMNPFRDLRFLMNLRKIYSREKPTLVHHFTIKPTIFGSIAAKLAGVSGIVNTITGLGYTFAKTGFLNGLVAKLYKIGLSGCPEVIFQNSDDYDLFITKKLVSKSQAHVVLGSGINTNKIFPRNSRIGYPTKINFLLIARMLWSKGIKEFVTAAEIVKKSFPECQFVMAGGFSGAGSRGNPDKVPVEWLHKVNEKGVVKWLGRLENKDVLLLLDKASVLVLPSYREGIPKTLLEGAAKAKPIITTDSPGCREVVIDQENGFLVPVRNSEKLAESMMKFIQQPGLVDKMGTVSRKRAETLFDEKIIFQNTIMVYEKAIN
jgi:glycosyltransferase involved in cell wall biosynthesis